MGLFEGATSVLGLLSMVDFSIYRGRVLIASVAILSLLLPASNVPQYSRSRSLADTVLSVAQPYAFDLTRWQASAIARGFVDNVRAELTLPGMSDSAQYEAVTAYFATMVEVEELQRWSDTSTRATNRGQGEEALLKAAEKRRDELAVLARGVLARQTSVYLAEEGIATIPLRPVVRLSFPPIALQGTAPVFFTFTKLPLVLLVAPRDRIEVLNSTFLRSDLAPSEIEDIEGHVDRANVSSIVLPIGGFASYPSMIGYNYSLRRAIGAIAHEWVHHFLALRPLGWRYFEDHRLRSINETVADLAGDELAGRIFDRHYRSYEGPRPTQQREGLDFSRALAEVRHSVEELLDRGDVVQAERLMAERRDWLVSQGYRIRKLNTAYLTFYGAYAGSGNAFEPKLRRLRDERGSLAAFLEAAATITAPENLDIMLSH